MWQVNEEEFQKIAEWNLEADPFAAVKDYSDTRAEQRWLNPEQKEIYNKYVAARNEYIKSADFDKYYREAEKPIDRQRWTFLMQRKAWFIMPLGWDIIARNGGRIVDLGCGDGDTVQRLIDHIERIWKAESIEGIEVEIIGIDLNHSRIRNATELVTCNNTNITVRFEQGDAIGSPLAYADRYFDYALCCGVFEILDDDQFEQFLREMSRITAKGMYVEDLYERFPGGFPRDTIGKHMLENGFLVKQRHVIMSEPFSITKLQDPKKLWPVLLDQNIWAEAVEQLPIGSTSGTKS